MPTPDGFELSSLRLEAPKPRPKKTFPSGVKLGRGRGVVNKITRDLKAGILNGAAAFGADGRGAGGLDGFLMMCAAKYPKQYMQLLGKLLPLAITADGAIGSVNVSLNVQSIPSGSYLTPETIEKLRQPQLIEHSPQAEPERDEDSTEELAETGLRWFARLRWRSAGRAKLRR